MGAAALGAAAAACVATTAATSDLNAALCKEAVVRASGLEGTAASGCIVTSDRAPAGSPTGAIFPEFRRLEPSDSDGSESSSPGTSSSTTRTSSSSSITLLVRDLPTSGEGGLPKSGSPSPATASCTTSVQGRLAARDIIAAIRPDARSSGEGSTTADGLSDAHSARACPGPVGHATQRARGEAEPHRPMPGRPASPHEGGARGEGACVVQAVNADQIEHCAGPEAGPSTADAPRPPQSTGLRPVPERISSLSQVLSLAYDLVSGQTDVDEELGVPGHWVPPKPRCLNPLEDVITRPKTPPTPPSGTFELDLDSFGSGSEEASDGSPSSEQTQHRREAQELRRILHLQNLRPQSRTAVCTTGRHGGDGCAAPSLSVALASRQSTAGALGRMKDARHKFRVTINPNVTYYEIEPHPFFY